jgi:lipopolysaccharide transport protein LptA
MSWQRSARLIVAVAFIAFAIVLAFAFRARTPAPVSPARPSSDPKAVIETAGGDNLRLNRDQEEVRTEFEKLLRYQDGTTKMLGMKVTTERAGGRTFTLTGKEGEFGPNESQFTVSGDVHLGVSDGLQVRTGQATYAESDGIVRAAGPVQFSRGRMRGAGVGFTYDKNADTAAILTDVVIHVAADRNGDGAADITAGFAELNRATNSIRLEGGVKTARAAETTESDTALAHLTDDEDRLQRLELRGHSRLNGSARRPGALQSLAGNDIDLQYGSDGRSIEHAVITGDAVVQLAGDQGSSPPAARQISAQQLDIVLADDGATPTALNARNTVQVTLPGVKAGVSRTIHAETLVAAGEAARGLTRATFSGDVRFRERGPELDRAVRAGQLDAALTPGFAGIQDATFRHAVRFEEGGMVATAAEARYLLDKGTLELSGSEPGATSPRVVNKRLAVDAAKIRVGLAGPQVAAAGSVRSTLQPAPAAAGAGADGQAKLPGMLKEAQPVHVTANELAYDGTLSRATYTGAARLSQGDTSIKGDTIVLDEKTGDLTASGSVATATVLVQDTKGGAGTRERVSTIATAKELQYVDESRRATYSGDAHVTGPQGDMTAARIELYFKPAAGDELDRVEAYDGVALRQPGRTTNGSRMTYFSADERYLVSGTPLKVLDECGRETTGRTLTFFRTTDRIVIDGSEQTRTHTKGGSGCR